MVNEYIKINLDDRNRGANNELCQKLIIQVSVPELHIDMVKKDANAFSMVYDEKGLPHFTDSYIQLIL